MATLYNDFGFDLVNSWVNSMSNYSTSQACPGWIPAFRDIFGVEVEEWYLSSVIPNLFTVFSFNQNFDAQLEELPPSPYCSPSFNDSYENLPMVPVGLTEFVEIGCAKFQDQSEAQVWFDYFFLNYGDIGGLDSKPDGTACGVGDWGGLTECDDGTLKLEQRCGLALGGDGSGSGCPSGQEKTVGQCNEILHTCGSFDSQGDAQTWFEANPDYGENIDTNGDGTACGQDDNGGETMCPSGERLLPQFCAGYLGNS